MNPHQFKIFLLIISFITNISHTHAAGKKDELSLDDLGFKKEEMQANPELDNLLKVRKHDLDLHEKWGLATLALMTAAMATGKSDDVTDAHKWLGLTAGLTYYVTSYYALSTPVPEKMQSKGSTLWHKRLAWIHFPAMILVPVLGFLAESQLDNGEKIHGIAKLHKPAAAAAFWSFAASFAVLKFDF